MKSDKADSINRLLLHYDSKLQSVITDSATTVFSVAGTYHMMKTW